MAAVSFPALVPSSRSYSPGVFPEQQFQAQNGAVVRVRYGNQRYSSSLSLTFANITDANAALILQNFVDVMDDDNYAEFTTSNVAAGASTELVPWIRDEQLVEVEICRAPISYERQARTVYSDV